MSAALYSGLVSDDASSTLQVDDTYFRKALQRRIASMVLDMDTGRFKDPFSQIFDPYRDAEYPLNRLGMHPRADIRDYLGRMPGIVRYVKQHLFPDECIRTYLDRFARLPERGDPEYWHKKKDALQQRQILLVDQALAAMTIPGSISFTEEWKKAAASKGNRYLLEEFFRFPLHANRVLGSSLRDVLIGFSQENDGPFRAYDHGSGAGPRTSLEILAQMYRLAEAGFISDELIKTSRWNLNDVSLEALIKGRDNLLLSLRRASVFDGFTAAGGVRAIPANFMEVEDAEDFAMLRLPGHRVWLNGSGGAVCHVSDKDKPFRASRAITVDDGIWALWDYHCGWSWGAEYVALASDGRRRLEFRVRLPEGGSPAVYSLPMDGPLEMSDHYKAMLYHDLGRADGIEVTAYMTKQDFIATRATYTATIGLLGYVRRDPVSGVAEARRIAGSGERADEFVFRYFTDCMRKGERFSFAELLGDLPSLLGYAQPFFKSPFFAMEAHHGLGYSPNLARAGFDDAIDVGAAAAFLRFGQHEDLSFIDSAYISKEDVEKLNHWFGHDERFTRAARRYAVPPLEVLLSDPKMPSSISGHLANMVMFSYGRPSDVLIDVDR